MAGKPKTIDEYLSRLSHDKRAALEELRKTIKAAAPNAEECISYQPPTFRQNGMLVGFGATANHCAFYLMSSTMVAAHKDELEAMARAKAQFAFRRTNPFRPHLCASSCGLGSRRTTVDVKIARRFPAV